LLALVLLLPVWAGAAEKEEKDEKEEKTNKVARELVEIIRNSSGRFTTFSRAAAARTLGDLGYEARGVVAELASILSDPKRCYPNSVDEALVTAVGRIGAPAREAIPSLVRNVGRERDLDRAIAAAVQEILNAPDGPGNLPGLLRQLRNSDPAARLKAVKKLIALGPDGRAAAPALTDALSDPDPDVRRLAITALIAVQPNVRLPEAAITVFVTDLQDPDEGIRLRAAKELGRFGPAALSAVAALQAAARNDPDLDVRRVAADALFRIQGK
jgi:HEAT repeat protein